VQIDRKRLDALLRTAPGKADEVVGGAAYDLQADVQTHFNEQSPAPAGEPPGVVTGNLRASISVARIRQALWEMRVAATYAEFLEFGTPRMSARPFVRPAVWRLSKRYGKLFKVIVE
jgi:HK97 gp10 family phage protein